MKELAGIMLLLLVLAVLSSGDCPAEIGDSVYNRETGIEGTVASRDTIGAMTSSCS